jgi:hypothetical protein
MELTFNVANVEFVLNFVLDQVRKHGFDAGAIDRLMVAVFLIAQNFFVIINGVVVV